MCRALFSIKDVVCKFQVDQSPVTVADIEETRLKRRQKWIRSETLWGLGHRPFKHTGLWLFFETLNNQK